MEKIKVRHLVHGEGLLVKKFVWKGIGMDPEGHRSKEVWSIELAEVIFSNHTRTLLVEELTVLDGRYPAKFDGERNSMNYFVAECKGCNSTQGGYTSHPQETATLYCKKCGRSSLLKCNDRPEGAYVWYFGPNIHVAQAKLQNLKITRKK